MTGWLAGARRLELRPGWLRDEAGFTAVEFTAGVGFLVLPVAVLVLSVPTWAGTQNGARVAAREAARVLVLADDDTAGQRDAATAAQLAATNHGIELVGAPRFRGSVEGPAGRAELVTATVTVRLPLLGLPFLADLTAIHWEVEHTEPVDLYRSRP